MSTKFLSYCYMFMVLIVLHALIPTVSWALPTTPEQAKRVVQNWMGMDLVPLEASIGSVVREVSTFNDNNSEPLYHIVYMEPQGFVIVAGDDLVEPIIGFIPAGKEFNDSLDNPLGALVTQDVPTRVMRAREMERLWAAPLSTTENSLVEAAKSKWSFLDRDEALEYLDFGLSTISDVRVAPFMQTNWNQQTESGGKLCYNLFTPENYPSGCVATAFAQIMRFYQFPTTPVGTPSFIVSVDGTEQSQTLLGGDGTGGVYDWALMDNGPIVSDPTHRTAIGRLMHDTGASVNMSYTATGSGSDTLIIADRLKSNFSYTNAIKGYNSGFNIVTTNLNNMTNPNLDAGYPVVFGITGTSGGHAIVGDGYGYNSNTLYHHLNMGWGGYENAWYNLPNIDSFVSFTSVYKAVYNIYTSGTGEIISGRVVDSGGNPISGVTVTATRTGGGTYTDLTDSNGIYAIAKIPSASTYLISASSSGYNFNSQSTNTLTSSNTSTVGNKWGIDFVATSVGAPWVLYLPAILSGVRVDNR